MYAVVRRVDRNSTGNGRRCGYSFPLGGGHAWLLGLRSLCGSCTDDWNASTLSGRCTSRRPPCRRPLNDISSVLTEKDPPVTEDPAPNLSKILDSPSYRVAYKDVDFLMRPEMRAARIELELLKPELYLRAEPHPLDGRRFRQHADRGAGGRPAAARRGRSRVGGRARTIRRAGGRWSGRRRLRRAEPLLRRRPRVRPAGLRRRAGQSTFATT